MKQPFLLLLFLISSMQTICFPVGAREGDEDQKKYARLFDNSAPSQNLVQALEDAKKAYMSPLLYGSINCEVSYVKALVTEIADKEPHDKDELEALFMRANFTIEYTDQSTYNRPLYAVIWTAKSKTGAHAFSRPICSLTETEKSGEQRSVPKLYTVIHDMIMKKFRTARGNPAVNQYGVHVYTSDRLQCLADGSLQLDGKPFECPEIDLRAASVINEGPNPHELFVDHPDDVDETTPYRLGVFYKNKLLEPINKQEASGGCTIL